MKLFIHIAIILTFLCASCSQKGTMDKRFSEVDAMCDSDPKLAMSMLDSIDYGSLSATERHRYDLLTIKSRDKAYVRHTSDSLIIDVIDYYESHRKTGLYPEALYYGGRVYSDIGDLPTALTYFQQALKAIPEDKEHLRFKRNVLNQTGRLLHSLRLDSAAIEYINRSIAINDQLKEKDSGIAFAHSLLGRSYLNIKDIHNAHLHISKAVGHSSNLSEQDQANILSDLAGILLIEGKLDAALNTIRPLLLLVDSIGLSACLATTSEIYRIAGIPDTAYMYARQLTRQKGPSNKRIGYKVIFSEELRDFVPKDTLIALLPEYKKSIEDYLNTHEGEQAIIQNTKYNYGIHERERLKAEKKLYLLIIIASIAVIISLSLTAWILYRKFRKADTEANFVAAINVMKESSDSNSHLSIQSESDNVERPEGTNEAVKLADIKKQIMAGIRTADDKDLNSLVNPGILTSQIYIALKEKTETGCPITNSEENHIYNEIEELIEIVSEGFSYRLRILTEDKVTNTERRMAMLMKCGFSPLQIAILFGREKNTISTHRRNLAFKITGEKKADRALDMIIISL